ncbi:hypothetical protein C8039_11640 [Halogeometricum sp. wsp3]|nr:hypothetical protein C8039_11640 [Halogeometricum sp. wsp3]
MIRLGNAIQRHRSEQRRRESERRFREIAEVSPDTIFRLDIDGVFTFVSPAIESLLGYSPEELVDTPFRSYVPEERLEAAFDGFSRVAAGETVREFELRLTDADGEPVYVEVSASPVTHDGSVRIIQLVRWTHRTKLPSRSNGSRTHEGSGEPRRWACSSSTATVGTPSPAATKFVPGSRR